MALEPSAAAPGGLTAGTAASPRAPSAPLRTASSSVPAARTPQASGARPAPSGLRHSTVESSLTLHVGIDSSPICATGSRATRLPLDQVPELLTEAATPAAGRYRRPRR